MSRTQVCKKVDLKDGARFEFANGNTHVVKLGDFSQEIQLQYAVNGVKQKLGDAYAGALGNAVEAERRFLTVLNATKNGDWTVRGEAGPRVTVLAETLARAKGMDIEAAVEFVNGMDDDGKKRLRSHPAIKKASAAIRLERAQKDAERTGDTDEELDLDSIA